MNEEVRKRLKWIEYYQQVGNLALASRRCGISRFTLRKWLKRYQAEGLPGLEDKSRCPKHSPNQKIGQKEERWILELRAKRNLGARRIQTELIRLHDFRISLDTIHKVLKRHKVPPLKRPKRRGIKRYSRPIPGDRIQMDTMKVAPGVIQYTAVDDCTRYRVLAIYPRKTGANTLKFLDHVIEEMPFPIQRIQTDRGTEFFATKVQEKMMEYCIKFRPIRPASPHLNGKVERSQRTDIEEFYATVDLKDQDFPALLDEWQHHYNWHRPHGGLNGKAPMERYFEVANKTPFSDEVEEKYDISKERIRESNYRVDLKLANR